MAIEGNTFVVGSRFFYVLSKGNGRPKTLYLPCTVVKVTNKRVVIRLDQSPCHRNVLPWALTNRDANGNSVPSREVA